MTHALAEAETAFREGEVPVGAVLAGPEGDIVSKAHNQPISLNDPTAHAEMLALREGAAILGNYRLNGCILVATIEPCIMCMGAAIQARIGQIGFGARDPKAGAAGSLYDLPRDARLNHRVAITSGIMEAACRDLMQRFFRARRRT